MFGSVGGKLPNRNGIGIRSVVLLVCNGTLCVLKHSVPKMFAFAFGLCLRSQTQRFKAHVLGRSQPARKYHTKGRSRSSVDSPARKKKVYTTTVETLLFFFFRVWGSMVYTLLSRTYGVYPFPLFFPGKMVYTIAFFALWPQGRATDREKRGPVVVVYALFFPGPVSANTGFCSIWAIFQQQISGVNSANTLLCDTLTLSQEGPKWEVVILGLAL